MCIFEGYIVQQYISGRRFGRAWNEYVFYIFFIILSPVSYHMSTSKSRPLAIDRWYIPFDKSDDSFSFSFSWILINIIVSEEASLMH